MNVEWLSAVPVVGVFFAAIALSLIAIEVGFRIGRREKASEKGTSFVGTTLSLLAFMLAFTFGLAASRFEARRGVVLDEANAIGTAYLRARLLPAPLDAEAKRKLLQYVELRIANRPTPRQLSEGLARSEALHRELFDIATTAAKADPHAITAGLFVEAMNDVIDLHERRVMAGLRTRIPPTIWAALWLLSGVSMLAVGLEAGAARERRLGRLSLLVLSFGIVMALIADLDDPRVGFLTTNQRALIDTQESMRANP